MNDLRLMVVSETPGSPSLLLPVIPATLIGSIICLLVSIYCLRQLALRLGMEHKICRMVGKVPGGKWVLG